MPGTHSISFHSTDNAGNVETAHANVFTVVPLPCDVNADGSMNVIDIQIIILEALGMAPAVNDLDHDHVVNVADVQTVVRAALGFGCPNNP